MKRLDNVLPLSNKLELPLKYLVVVMASMMVIPVSQADVAGKKIGDLEIYKAAEGGKTTITMMLDTSGSMAANVSTGACDMPSGISSNSVQTENSSTSPSYTRRYCSTSNRYFYRLSPAPENQWYRCGDSDGSGDNGYNFAICSTTIANPNIGDEYSFVTSSSGNKYYYKDKFYDRLTRLKDALFTLMNNTQIDNSKVSIGIGQFSSQSGSNNTYTSADGTSGKILVPARLLDQTQRNAIKAAVAPLIGSNGTPTANAYAEVGAYMLGKNTSALVVSFREEYVKINGNQNRYYQCTSWSNSGLSCSNYNNNSYITTTFGSTVAPCQNNSSLTCLSREYTQTTEQLGYSGFAKSATDSKLITDYISPLSSPSSCDGRGIYFLTDGEPNSSPNPLPLMKSALGSTTFTIPATTLPSGSQSSNGMPEVGAFAKALRDPTINPLGTDREIYTAVVGFGSVFDVNKTTDAAKPIGSRVIRNLSYANPTTGVTANRDFYNCENITNIDAKNACNWGEKSHNELPGVGGFGEGGFYSAQSTDDIVNSIIAFVSDLNQELPSTPSGTIIIPDDPYRADSQLAVAYYPTLQSKVAENSVIWNGNMKKYSLNEGTLYGQNNRKLFENVAGELDPATQDLWSDRDYPNANNSVESGGFYARLNTPTTGVSTVRALYVEDLRSTTVNTTDADATVLRKFGVNNAGKVTLDNTPLSSTTFNDSATYSEDTLRKLLNFLGFDTLPSTATLVKNMTLTTANASVPIKVVGATVHSTPASVSYSATLDADGKVTDQRDDYVLFGSTEGGLHLVDADDYSATGDGGRERFVIIPREILKDSSKSAGLVKDATKTDIGSPNFGIDAPWLVTADYKYDFPNLRVDIDTTNDKGLFAYGGLRLGGEAFYGIDLHDPDNPSMLFSITPATSNFSRMGQIWSKPTEAKIKTSETDTGTDVLVFGGGYDTCYENESFQVGVIDTALGTCSNKSSAKGNAVYIINANTGDLIWSASSDSTASRTVSSMTNSIVAGVTTLDRDNDGFMDHLYFADLGGQIFRADFTNAGFVRPVTSGTASPESSFTNTRVTRVLASAYTGNDTKYNYRFYERPVVSFYRNSVNNTLFALVNAISGDRSSPLSKIRDTTKSDRLYGIIDNDVTKADAIFYAGDFATTSGNQDVVDLNDAALTALPSAIGAQPVDGYTSAQKNAVIDTMRAGASQGWYYPLNRFDGYNNVRYTKGIGKSEVISNFLYTTVYNPDMSYGTTDSCTAQIVGGSERQLYCLPYGICIDDTSENGTGGFARAGQGIQELTLGPRSSTLSNQRLLIGTRTLTERTQDRVDFGTDSSKGGDSPIDESQSLNASDQILGDGTAGEYIFNDRFTLQPKTWYEVD
ncbi:PilC/PilY family type IV pilus protein [Psychrobacter sp. SCQQ22]|uniref:PilC/PilY family type IV pilus protein n=1 Tax=Psychrobacter sp. SCQQ22 TaxID=2792059 RepID=UPI001D101A2F|nr:PilC/PilY family type IV pilus protein [Psychrobacter sp. SCQQ22]